jgi:hypothetical protein
MATTKGIFLSKEGSFDGKIPLALFLQQSGCFFEIIRLVLG